MRGGIYIKKCISILISCLLLFSVFPIAAYAADNKVTATKTASKVLVDGVEKLFDAYNINGNNYFKLRDIAFTLSGTSNQFEVQWDSSKNAINLITGKSYTVIGGEMTVSSDKASADAIPSTSKVYLDGEEIALTAYNINGSNYFKLRDIGNELGFIVDWDDVNRIIIIETISKDEEIERAIALGIVPDEIQGEYNEIITFAQYSQMLTNLIKIWDDSRLSEWESIIETAAKSDEIMLREDGILAASYAFVLMEANTFSMHYDEKTYIAQEEVDKQMEELSWNYPYFPDWEKIVYPVFRSNYMWGGVQFFMNKVSKISMKAVYPYDLENHSMHLQNPLTRKEAIQSVLRLAETDAAIFEPDGNYVSVEKAGTYNKQIITDALLSQLYSASILKTSKNEYFELAETEKGK